MRNVFEKWSSVKSFKDREVPETLLNEIFADTTKAPTAFNLQPYYFKVLDSEESFENAAKSLIPENKWVENADKIVVLIGDKRINTNFEEVAENQLEEGLLDQEDLEEFRQRIKSYSNRSEGFKHRWLARNTMIPATFFMLSCADHGLGCCPVKGFEEKKLSESLGLEDYESPQLMIPIGYPKDDPKRLWRRNAEEIYEII